jgi:hypothetical protein
MKANRRQERLQPVIVCLTEARERAEHAIYALDRLGAPTSLIESLERARDELEETEERLTAYATGARKAA